MVPTCDNLTKDSLFNIIKQAYASIQNNFSEGLCWSFASDGSKINKFN